MVFLVLHKRYENVARDQVFIIACEKNGICMSLIHPYVIIIINCFYLCTTFICLFAYFYFSIYFSFGFSWSRSSCLIHFVEPSEFELLRIVFTIFCNNGQWIWKFTCKLWKQIRKEQQINKYICMKYMFPCHGMCRYLRTWCRNICYVCYILHNIHTRTLACNPYIHALCSRWRYQMWWANIQSLGLILYRLWHTVEKSLHFMVC